MIANQKLFDGIQVSVNSDDEEEELELDYNDDVLMQEEDVDLDQEFLDEHTEGNFLIETQNKERNGVSNVENTSQSPPSAALALGTTSASLNEEQVILNNPHLCKLLDRMLDEHIKDAKIRGESSSLALLTTMKPQDEQDQVRTTKQLQNTSKKRVEGAAGAAATGIIKSPSDTTIYVPAIARAMNCQVKRPDRMNQIHINSLNGQCVQSEQIDTSQDQQRSGGSLSGNDFQYGSINPRQEVTINSEVIANVSTFVDQMRIEHEESQRQAPGFNTTLPPREVMNSSPRVKSTVTAAGYPEAQRRMEQAIVEAEKFKAAEEKSPGTIFTLQQQESSSKRAVVGEGYSDDDFFHLTCHIDPNLKRKIENGEYVDLDKLLPKDSAFAGRTVQTNETKLEWVQSEGSTYLVLAKSVSKINCFRRWEQAFRMYVTLYCTKNPERAREIWQYISVINTAAMSYNWDNVYNYDIVFRQLMEFNPSRSWAVTYNQMWNLSMTNPITGNNGGQRRGFLNGNGNQSSLASSQNKRKMDYCWSFNKGVRCKFGKKCKFIEQCSYCDSTSHGVISCDKLDKKEREARTNSKGNGAGKKCRR